METVLVVGATGNIGVAVVQAALRSGRKVLAIVRNQTSADKLFHYLGTKEGITTVEADVTSDHGVQSVVDQVKAGKLPAFQHVYSCAGGAYDATPLQDITTEDLRHNMLVNFEANFCEHRTMIRTHDLITDEGDVVAYSATVPYLLEKNYPRSTYTLCTGSQGDLGLRAAPALTQGALYSLANVASRDNAKTNIRFNEVYVNARVLVDAEVEGANLMKSSEFSKHYDALLARYDIRGCRVYVQGQKDLEVLRFVEKHNE